MTNRHVVAACLAVCFSAASAAAAPAGAAADGEKILKFHSEITVDRDGWMTVVETITVRCEAQKIKRGIYRDFPVLYKGRLGFGKVRVPLRIVLVERDGHAEPFHTKAQGDYRRIYFGTEKVLLDKGVYTYQFTYRTRRQVGFFADHDELYWNVTGNEWEFPIDSASATVILPELVPREKIALEAYTGPRDAKGKHYSCQVDRDGRATFKTTRALGMGEGLTIVVTFPRGFVRPPTGGEKVQFFLMDNGTVVAGAAGLVVVLIYYFVAWFHVGGDPAKGVVIPMFEAPEGLCPAAVRYLKRMGFDKSCFAAGVVSMAVKKFLRIKDDDGEYSLLREGDADERRLSGPESKAAGQLFRRSGTVKLENAHHATFTKAIEQMTKALAAEHEGDDKHFVANAKWFVPGAVLSVLTLGAVAVSGIFIEQNPTVGFLCLWLTLWTAGVFFLVKQTISNWKAVLAGTGKRANAIFMTLFAVPFCIAEVVVMGILVYSTSIWLLPVLALLVAVNLRFHHWLKRPTHQGRKLMDRIEGLRMYLGTAERDLLASSAPPDKTPELFEHFLPYAMALDVENAWADKFEDVLAAAAAGEGGYSPTWYHGAAFSTLGASAFSSSFGGSFSSALSSASTAPGSSSGSGGGGSSGGGGGGGGGGGW